MEKSICFFFFFFVSPFLFTAAQPLYTNSRWIVNESGERVKMGCVNWPSHLNVMVAEGLSKQPVDEISRKIIDMGFNCITLSWADFLFTNNTLGSTSVRQSFKKLQLYESIEGFQTNNPSIIDLSLINAFQAVVASLARNNLLIILDNHISKPGWCCKSNDGNGFFGDEYFNPDLWIKGLTKVATTFKDTKNVVAMSLRNELRGLKQNVNDWYRYMQRGAEAVHAANPNVLVIISGLQFSSNLSFLANKPVSLSFSNKTVFDLHWYAYTDGQAWESGNPNQVCSQKVSDIQNKAGFLLQQGYPLFLGQFGFDMRGTNVNDNRFFDCLMGWAAEFDVDWGLWVLPGSYYIRKGILGVDETYGIFNWNWCEIRNQTILQKISALRYSFTGPSYLEAIEHKLLFHPMTGLCVKRMSLSRTLVLGLCSEPEAWDYSTLQETLTIKETYLCLQVDGLGKPAKLGINCSRDSSKWEPISDSKMHLSSKLENDTTVSVCLDIDSNNTIVTNNCKCLYNDTKCDPASQWFKIINSTRYVKNFLGGSSKSMLVKPPEEKEVNGRDFPAKDLGFVKEILNDNEKEGDGKSTLTMTDLMEEYQPLMEESDI